LKYNNTPEVETNANIIQLVSVLHSPDLLFNKHARQWVVIYILLALSFHLIEIICNGIKWKLQRPRNEVLRQKNNMLSGTYSKSVQSEEGIYRCCWRNWRKPETKDNLV